MSAKVVIKNRIMPFNERLSLQREVASDEADMKGDFKELYRGDKKLVENLPGFGLTSGNVKALEQRKKALRDGEIPNLTKQERIAWAREEKEQAEWLRKHMVPVEDVQAKPGEAQFLRTASELSRVEHSPDFLFHMNRWKNIRRTLYGKNDPTAAHEQHIRPRRGEMGSP